MKVSLNWIQEYLDTPATPAEIATTLTQLGLVVDAQEDRSAKYKGFVVAEIKATHPHPDADRLQVCEVCDGAAQLQIVCGAPNARAGLKVVLGQVGAVVPANAFALKRSKIRGVESQGMLCSTAELDLAADSDGIMELPTDAPVGTSFASYYGLDDILYDIEVTPNRGDCLSALGVARDLAAAGLGTLKDLKFSELKACAISTASVKRQVPEAACPHFGYRLIKGVKNSPSPQWLQKRLRSIGLQPKSAVVDITNYILHGLGRPMHAYDLNKLTGDITIRRAQDQESFTDLNKTIHPLTSDMMVIADSQHIAALAGVMGGWHSRVQEETTDILLESAVFDPVLVAKTGRQLKLQSDSRYRFERGVDAAQVLPALDYATSLILEICGGNASQGSYITTPAETPPIIFDPAMVLKITGLEMPAGQILALLQTLGCQVNTAQTPWEVTPPTWRHDLTIAQDLVEEVLRLIGYDALPSIPLTTMPDTPASLPANFLAVRVLTAAGLEEVSTYPFISHAHATLFGGGTPALHLSNPISHAMTDMRPSLLPNLLLAAQANADRSVPLLSLFEWGTVFDAINGINERPAVAGLRAGPLFERHWAMSQRSATPYKAKADALRLLEALGILPHSVQVRTDGLPSYFHPGRSGALCLGPKNILGYFGELHPQILQAMNIEVSPVVGFEIYLNKVPERGLKRPAHNPLPKLQPVDRDFAFVVPQEVRAADLITTVRKVDPTLIEKVTIFDVYMGDKIPAGLKSIAFSIRLQPRDKTLTDADLQQLQQAIITKVEHYTGGSLRL